MATSGDTKERLDTWIQSNYVARNFVGGLSLLLSDRVTKISFTVLLGIALLGLLGPAIAPYEYTARHYDENGELMRLEQPSVVHPLGTTVRGEDVLSRLLYGARPTMLTGLVGGTIILSIGMFVGVTSGYLGGWVESLLMRITDFAYGVPLIPFAIVLVTLIEAGFWTSVVVLGLILWRGSARVLRSQVLQIKERPYIMSAKATGASTPRIIIKHIVPNVISMAALFFAQAVGIAIIYQANLVFIGVANPFLPSWGTMVRNAYQSGVMSSAWWWALPPGLCISITVLATFLVGRGYERLSQGSVQGELNG